MSGITLKHCRIMGYALLLIVASDNKVGQLDGAFLSRLNGLYVRQNLGYDFGAWAHILRDDPNLFNAETLYLINDSTIGPLNNRKFEELLLRVRSSTKDLIGLTDSYERQWHIQSYFLALKGSALSSSALRSFLGRIKNLSGKNDVINAYEMPFATFLENGGLSCEVLFPAKKAHNPTLAE
jgi:lipopolysaccharide biosynthesis protein